MNRKYEPMYCPVCTNFYFSELQEGDNPDEFQCLCCGWKYDLNQIDFPDEPGEKNGKSLNTYKKWYNSILLKNPNYRYLDEVIPAPVSHICPVCEKHLFKDEDSYDICPVCGWEDDSSDKNPDDVGVNGLSFSEYKKLYRQKLLNNPDYRWKFNI